MRFKRKYFVGQILGLLTLTEYIRKGLWRAACVCGSILEVSSNHLYRRKSCGCESINKRYKKGQLIDIQLNIKYNHYKQGATRRKIEFSLTKEEFKYIVFSKCQYCKLPPHKEQKYKHEITLFNGVDRVDSNLGYILNNCVPCCSWCNFSKSNRPVQEYLDWLQWVKNNV